MINILNKETKKPKVKKAKINGQKKSKKDFFSKLSGAFMLPISVMAIAGLFLGIGSAIASNNPDTNWETLGNFIQALGGPIFSAMPVLFAMAIVVAFTEEAGVAVFAAVIGMLIFSSIQDAFIHPISYYSIADKKMEIGGYKILFTQLGRSPKSLFNLVGSTMGITSLNTSIFGGIIVGTITARLYNNYHTIKLPIMFAFFGGKRFVSLIVILSMIPLAFSFLLFWPWIGIGLYEFGNSLQYVPYGIDSFIFGYTERALIPFGLHHVFYAPLWWSSAGGDATTAFDNWLKKGNHLVGPNANAFIAHIKNMHLKWKGDSFIWISANQLPFNTIDFVNKLGVRHSLPVFDFFSNQLGIKLGRFMDGKFPLMIFGLPAAAFAMVMAAPKENRKVTLGTIIPATITCLSTGVTEPIEFTFLFLAPLLFWGFHAIMAGIAFMFMNIFGAHIGMTFSGGLLDLLIYGILPLEKGTHFWWTFLIGIVYVPIYFTVFYYWIIKRNLSTPGRGDNTQLFMKKDYKDRKRASKTGMTQQSKEIVIALGGWDNIVSFSNCATRLRYDIKDFKKVNEAQLKNNGAFGIVKVGSNHIQVIMGVTAEQINENIKTNKGATLEQKQVIHPTKRTIKIKNT